MPDEEFPIIEDRFYTADLTVRFFWPAVTDAVTRITGRSGDEWRSQLYELRTEKDVLEHWTYNALMNNVSKASQLDGWADLEPENDVHFVVALLHAEES